MKMQRIPLEKRLAAAGEGDSGSAYGDVKNMFVAEAAAKALAGACPEEGRTELLFRLLVAPFCGRQEENEGGSR